MTQLRDCKDMHEQPDALPKWDDAGCVKLFKVLDECLGSCTSKRNLPLCRAARPEVAAPAHADDPSANYAMATKEMIACAPHGDDPACATNNGKALDIMAGITREAPARAHVKLFIRTKGGHGAHCFCLLLTATASDLVASTLSLEFLRELYVL